MADDWHPGRSSPFGQETSGVDQGGIDAERARLIESIYEAVLRPEHYDVFMADWSAHLDKAAARLQALRTDAAPAPDTLDDPLIEGHFRRAFAMLERMGRGPAGGSVQDLADTEAQPLFCIDRVGMLQGWGEHARALLGPAAGLAALVERLDPDSAARLDGLLAGVRRAPVVGLMSVLALAGDLPQDSDPKPSMPKRAGALLVAQTRRDPRGSVEIAIFPLALRWSETVAAALGGSFRLTARETELVRSLASGKDLAGIAQAEAKSMNTLRAQLKSVFQKTRAGSQADLMRLVAALIVYSPGPSVAEAGTVSAECVPDPGRVLTLPGHDGQPVQVHLIGPDSGRPVIFIHGMLDGIAVTRRIGRALAAMGLRLVAPVRRNFGNGVPDPRIREAPDLFARDLDTICTTLGIERTVLIGHMAGAVPAFAAAGRMGSRIAALVSVSGGVPIQSVRQFALMSPRQRAVAYTARFAPALLPAILRAGIAQIDGKDAVAFMNALYPATSRDRAVVSDPDVSAAIIDGYRFSVAQGEQAFRIDSWHVTRDWSDLVGICQCPIRLIHGAQDPVVHIDTVRDFAARSDRVVLDVLQPEGQLLFYSAPHRVLAIVDEAFRA